MSTGSTKRDRSNRDADDSENPTKQNAAGESKTHKSDATKPDPKAGEKDPR